jgi:hypothetical protein
MAGNSNKMATPSKKRKRESSRIYDCSQRWEDARTDIFRIYIQENKPLEATMAAILESHGLPARSVEMPTTVRNANKNSSERRWKDKFREWGYTKNITRDEMQFVVAKDKERREEGKDTNWFYRDTIITTKRIENFKRRTGEAPPTTGELYIYSILCSSNI